MIQPVITIILAKSAGVKRIAASGFCMPRMYAHGHVCGMFFVNGRPSCFVLHTETAASTAK